MAGNNSLELEIHNLFQEGNTLETICGEIISKYEKNDIISPSECESISHFLITAGKIELLFKFYLKCLRRNSLSRFPWGYFADAIRKYEPKLSDLVLDIIERGVTEQPDEDSCIRSPDLVSSIPEVAQRLATFNKKIETEKLQTKTKLMAQLNHNRLYQLAEQEEQTLLQLIKIFPNDLDVKILHQAHLEKKADEILNRVKLFKNNSTISRKSLDEKISTESQDVIDDLKARLITLSDKLKTEAPDQIYNLTMLAMQFELHDLSLDIINKAPKTSAGEWLKAEILFECGRFLELITHVEEIEKRPDANPESTYGAIYMKAQAYYGLGQKDLAIRMLESLSDKAPSYRSTEALLHDWKTN